MNDFSPLTILYWLDRIQPSDRSLVGEKAFLLSQLKQQGYPVLPGFVVSTTTFQTFLENLEDVESLLTDFPHSSLYLDVDNPKALKLVAKQSSQAIFRAALPSQWLSHLSEASQQLPSSMLIWRSSLSLPSSSQPLEGLLSAQISNKTPESLELALKNAWAALFSAKSLFYWQRADIGLEKVKLAIFVQPLMDAVASGKAFLHLDQFQIQATWGLGHSLLKGEVLPDIYKIDRTTGKVETKRLGNKTRAYHLKANSNDSNGLDIQLLDRVQQETFSLSDFSVTQLIQLWQRLTTALPKLTAIEWILTQDLKTETSQIYLVQCSVTPSLNISQSDVSITTLQPLLKGLAASPGVVTAPIQVILPQDSQLVQIAPNHILVTSVIQLNWLPLLKNIAGLITEGGSITSHAAIIARELGIPAIVGATAATQILKTGELILLNGDTGIIYHSSSQPSPTTVEHSSPIPLKIVYPISTKLMVNLSQSSSLTQAAMLSVDGVGLLRSEWLMAELFSEQSLAVWLQPSQQPKFIKKLTQLISQFTQAFAPRPVFYRSFDQSSEQSFLSQRGTYSYQLDPTLFDLELQALRQIQLENNTNIHLILPFVRSVEEFSFCRERVKKAQLMQSSLFQLWIMAEVPSVIFLLSEYVNAGVQGIAIGTNDLTQLLLGVDRKQTLLSEQLNASHPAMKAALKQLIQLSRTLKIPCSICGQAPVQYPELIKDLIKWGITAISVEPGAVLQTHEAIAQIEHYLCLEVARTKLL